MNNALKPRALARLSAAVLVAGSLIGLTPVADAQQAYTSSRTSLRAGPDNGYPQVGWIGGGAPVFVNGCVRGYHWCDVSAGGLRGWVSARHLNYLYQNRRVGLYGNGGVYGFPVVGFALGSYWDNHYRGQSWYGNQSYWNGWRPGHGHPQGYPHADFQPSRPAYAVIHGPNHSYAQQPHVYQAPPHVVHQPRPHQGEVRHQQNQVNGHNGANGHSGRQ